jgi:archaemetzincin
MKALVVIALLIALVLGCGEDAKPEKRVEKPAKPKREVTFATEAIGDASKLTIQLQRMLDPDGFAPMAKPQPGDWMYEHREPPQTFDDWRRSKPNMPYDGKNTIYLLPLGEFPDTAPKLEAMTKIVHAYFTLEVKLLPAVPIADVVAKQRINGGTKKPQLLAPDILKWLEKRLPADAYALMAVTMTDLYPDETWNFVFGMASFDERVGVQSFARQDPAFFGEPRAAGWQLTALRRATWTVVHEVSHMFGMHHCQYYECVIGGSNNQAESDRAPLHACPVCMHKLWAAIDFDPVKRELELAATLRALGITDEAEWSERRAKWIRDGVR